MDRTLKAVGAAISVTRTRPEGEQIEAADMIIELFGPPGSGKTTFALALAARLDKNGVRVHSRLSLRPGEDGRATDATGAAARFVAPARRLARPVRELALTAFGSTGRSETSIAAETLSSVHAGGRLIRRLRMWQYLTRLGAGWSQAAKSDDIWLFDQAYLQAIVSIAVANPYLTDQDLAALVELVPKSDLVVLLETASEEIQARLVRRRAQLGPIANFLEDRRSGVREQLVATARLSALLGGTGRPLLSLNSDNDAAREAGVDLVMSEIGKSAIGPISDTEEKLCGALCAST